MNESFNLYNKMKKKEEKDETNLFKKLLYSYLIKTLIVIAIFLGSLIYINSSKNNKKVFKKIVYTNSLSFAKIYNIYNKYLGDVIPFKNTKEDTSVLVSSEKLSYSSVEKENNGYLLTINENTSVSSIKSGIVTKITKDDKYINLVTVQDKNNLEITYGYIDDINVKLYDYVKKDEIIGIANKKLYLIFKKGDKYLSYEEYL